MLPDKLLFRVLTFLLTCSVLWFPDLVVRAQEPALDSSRNENTPAIQDSSDLQQDARKDQPILLDDVSNRSETISAELSVLLPHDTSRQNFEHISDETDRMLQEIKSHLRKTPQALRSQPNIRALEKLDAELVETQKHLQSLEKDLDKQLDELSTSLERIDSIAAVWKATDELAKTQTSAEATTITRIAAVRGEIDKARTVITKQRNELLSLRDKLVNPSVALSGSVVHIQSAVEARLETIFRADHPPLWSPLIQESFRQEWQAVGAQYFLNQLDAHKPGIQTIVFQLVLFMILALSFRWLRDRTRKKIDNVDHPGDAQLAFEHPWAMCVLMTAILTVPLHPLAPRSAGPIAAAFIALATLRIVLRFLPLSMAPLAWGLAILFTFDRVRDLLDTTPTLARLVFLGEIVGGLGLLLWLLRPSQILRIPEEWRCHPFVRLVNTAMRVGAGLFSIAILADLAGWSDLAILLGDGVLRSGFIGLFIFVLLKVFHGLATIVLVLPPLRLLRAISNHRQLMDHRIERILNILAVGLWGTLLCGQLGLLAPATDAISRILSASVTLGSLSVSVADVLVFVITVWLSFLLARLVQVILQEDVFTRVRTARGVPYAVSNLARYTVIFLGFLIGLSAAGVEMTKLAVVAGGLGVGIGFGLQNIVNNFVSGLILMFERPIDVGDTIEFSGTSGTMQRIGIRASLIRTFDGAEVIVPNGILISESVTNWTLSDRRRRIDLDVGVAYGTPAQRVIDLLTDVAKANPKVIPAPEPCAYFDNFGDSSLDFKLRVWFNSTSSTNIHSIRSEIAVAVQNALDEAGIEVPFPQRDLHLINMPSTAESELGTARPPADPEANP